MASRIIRQFGGEGFLDRVDMLAKTDFSSIATATTFHTLSEFGTVNEVWMAPNTTSGFDLNFTPEVGYNTTREIEISAAIHIADQTGVGTVGTDFMQIEGIAQLELATWPATGTVIAIKGSAAGSPAPTVSVDEIIRLEAGMTFYATVRVREEVSSSSNDGEVEIYINDQLIYQATIVNTGNFSVATVAFDEPSFRMTTYFRNISVREGWSTANGVAPKPLYIQDALPTSVAGTHTITGGAATQLDAITDGNSATYLSTTIPSEQLTLSFTPDPVLASYLVQSISTTFNVSRATAAPNLIDIDLENAGVSIAPTESFNVLSQAPAENTVRLYYDLSTPTALDDIDLIITNGS